MIIPDLFTGYEEYIPKKGIIHIGAHHQEEGSIYSQWGINNVLWIEAQEEVTKYHSGMINSCISDKDDEEVDFIVTNNGMSSSLLELKDHLLVYPEIVETRRIKVKTVTLDTLFTRLDAPFDKYDMINIDVQGAELKALKGAINVLKHITSIVTEINVREMYKECTSVEDLDIFLGNQGFSKVKTAMWKNDGWGDAFYIRT